ncbi:baseplate multidomain protein megatron [Hansschlegelia plantiphila]|uniref:Phage host specificity protein n=1 Tax=Hansschlegelia plantiphila TaxID=374655 RepID=A0A9W6J1Z4_9HYPH|nr:glycoside hydrolase/phage tail family protein [Hansschlegelia plantiphila]GLK67913.1 phage host specificity protein [Hansschlegelia plantiphila]
MAVLALTAVGAAVGGAILPGGIGLFGATLSGAALGGALGGLAGAAIDQSLLTPTQKQTGPRLTDIRITASTEGAPVMRVYGRMRVGGQVIWASRFRETKSTEASGGKGGGPKVKSTTYAYSASFAVGLCEGPIDAIGRVWADGEPIARGDYEIRLYRGTEDQLPDPKIVAVEGEDYAPAYRGLAYLVFEELPLEPFGNRVPQITVEVIRRPPSAKPQLEDLVSGVTLIPGSSEFAYATDVIERNAGFGAWEAENAHVADGRADMLTALDDLAALAPNAAHVSLVIAWHGTDLRAGHCEIVPKVETDDKKTRPWIWRVAGQNRTQVPLVSRIDGAPALGGAPADRAVHQAIAELKARGLKVMLNPFILMDVPAGNALPDPHGGAEQAAYPWRGRITCHPAPGRPGSLDRTAAAAADIDAFFGFAAPGDFGWNETSRSVSYEGPQEWSYRRFVLHMARVAQAAGGVDAFLIGSEMVGLTRLRDATGSYPAVARLRELAADVRAMLGPEARIGYAADWSEYSNHRPDDGSGDVIFHLDPLWADDNIDFVGIDNYVPLADWRDGPGHLDAAAGFRGPHDVAYLDANIEGGEGFDWFYADAAAREAQIRTPIVDTAHGEHWAFRFKDFRSWWENPHHDWPGGARLPTPTAWVPQSKPIVFCELGCPAVDKGANQPNVFVDPKSAESAVPYFSNGRRDDLVQRAALVAQISHWSAAGNNPLSALTGERMIDVSRIFLWTWDARPHAAFPLRSDVWTDSANWRLGHWLTGRLGLAALADVVADIAGELGVDLDLDDLEGLVRGYAPDRVMSAREAIEPLLDAYGATARASGATLRVSNRPETPVAELAPEDLADLGEKTPAFRLTRAQASEVPQTLQLRHVDPDADYRQGAVEARRLAGEGRAVAEASFALALGVDEAQALADGMLIEASVARERGEWALPPSRLALEPGDLVTFSAHGRTLLMRLDQVGEEFARPVKATRADPDVRDVELVVIDRRPPPDPARAVAPVFEVLDLPLLAGDEPPHAPRLAAYAKPWTPAAVYRSEEGGTFALDQTLPSPAAIGRLTAPLGLHASGRFDRANAIEVEIGPDRTLESRSESAVLGGANVCAVRGTSGAWEVVQFLDAELVGPGRWRLTGLLRGQAGTEDAIGADVDAAFVLIDDRTPSATLLASTRGLDIVWRAGPATRPRDDETYVETTAEVGARGLRPYAPVHLSARRDPLTGDVPLGWVRRTRLGGDDFEIRDVRLGEDSEAYEVAVLADGQVVRTFEASAPHIVYLHAQQIADFGLEPATIAFTVRQLSASVGPGLPAGAEIAV